MDTLDQVVPFERLLPEFPLVEIFANLDLALNKGTVEGVSARGAPDGKSMKQTTVTLVPFSRLPPSH